MINIVNELKMFLKKAKNIAFHNKITSCISIVIIFIVSLIVILKIITSVSSTPMALFARKTLFAGDANATPFSNYNEIKDKVSVIKNLKYDKDENTTYDIYYPKDKKFDNSPTIIWIHGGGFVGGDKDMLKYYATTLANDGYTIFTLNYSLAPETKYPTPINQLGKFVEHLKDSKIDVPYNMDNLFFAGDSAGAQIASQFVIIQSNDDYRRTTGFSKILDSKQINGVVLLCGPFDFRAFAKAPSPLIKFIFTQIGWSYFGNKNWINQDVSLEASIINNVNKDFPPTYITDGNTASFEAMGKDLENNLSKAKVSVKSRFFPLEKYGSLAHEFQFVMNTEAGEIVYNDILDFLSSYRK